MRKDRGGKITVCLVYPNEYRLGMTNLGFQTVYAILNSFDDCVCERAFLPDGAVLGASSARQAPLYSLESGTPLSSFDVVAFSISFEDDYLNIPKIFSLAGITLKADERAGGNWPLVVAGGAAVSLNPEPLADFIDVCVIGEAEGALREFIDVYIRATARPCSKEALLSEMDSLKFAYVPSLYDIQYDGPVVVGITPKHGAKKRVLASKHLYLDVFALPSSKVYTPHTAFKGASLIEIERGCGRGCRFCAAGFLYLPPRYRNVDAVKAAVKEGAAISGKVGLVGAAVSEHPAIKEIIEAGIAAGGSVTLSSLRLDMLDPVLMGLLKKAGYKTVTLAPEAGSQKMRDVINKGIDEAGVLDAARLAAEAGFTKLKLYFLVGLPLEEDADVDAIADLCLRIRAGMKKGSLTISVSPLVPKPVTPFQWHPFCDKEKIEKRLARVKKRLSRDAGISLGAVSATGAFVQAYLSRADRRAGRFIIDAAENGVRSAIRMNEDLITASVYRQRSKDELLPWNMIHHGVSKAYLWKEYQKGLDGKQTPPCDVGNCFRCGVC